MTIERDILKQEDQIDTAIGKMYDMCSPQDTELIAEIEKLSDQEELVLNSLREKYGLKTTKISNSDFLIRGHSSIGRA